MQLFTPRRRIWLICVALVAATVAVYWPVWDAKFVTVDDPYYVTGNPDVSAGLSWHGVAWAFNGAHEANYHPLTWLSHMLDCQLFGLHPRGHHAVNLLLHVCNTLLVFFVLRRMTGRDGCSVFVAAVFAVHPMHVESVAWVSERKDVLSALFWLLAMAAYAHYVARPSWPRYLLVALCFVLGLLCKPMLVTLPAALLLLDVWPLRRTPWLGRGMSTLPPPRDLWPLVREKLPLFAIAGAWCVVTVLAQRAGGAVNSMEHLPLGTRVGNAIVSYVRYARKFFWPSDLAAFYPLNRPWPLTVVIISLALLVLTTALVMINWRRRPYVAFGWLWFLGTLVPVIGLVHVGNAAMADRYMYLPMIGLAVAVAWCGADLIEQHRWARHAGVTAVFGLAAASFVTCVDVRYWGDSEALFARSIERTEPNVFALHNIGASMMQRHAYADAVEKFRQCADLQPSNPHVRRSYGNALRDARRFDDARAQYGLSLQISANDADTWDALGLLCIAQKNWPEAAARFTKAVEVGQNRASSWMNLAIAHQEMGQTDAALSDLREALAVDPRMTQAWFMSGSLLMENGKFADAAGAFTRAAAINPRNADVQYRLGLCLMQAGHGGAAIAPLMTAVQLKPTAPEPMARLAWLLATHPQKKFRRAEDAMFLAARAAELTDGKSADALDALAAALAEKQQFAEAAQTAAKAAAAARTSGDAALADQIEVRARQYAAGEPARDSSLAGADAGDALP